MVWVLSYSSPELIVSGEYFGQEERPLGQEVLHLTTPLAQLDIVKLLVQLPVFVRLERCEDVTCRKMEGKGVVINYGEGGGLQNGKIAGPKLFAPPLKTG